MAEQEVLSPQELEDYDKASILTKVLFKNIVCTEVKGSYMGYKIRVHIQDDFCRKTLLGVQAKINI